LLELLPQALRATRQNAAAAQSIVDRTGETRLMVGSPRLLVFQSVGGNQWPKRRRQRQADNVQLGTVTGVGGPSAGVR
jgi:hypothetical protein